MLQSVSIIGSGNWGSTIAKIIGGNVLKYPEIFNQQVRMWVYEEIIDGQKLSEIINKTHENIKYLPKHKLPENVLAVPNIKDACRDSNILVFVLPHEFVQRVCVDIKDVVGNARALSLIKGMDVSETGIKLVSEIITQNLGIETSVLMGANIAHEIANEMFSESTLACLTDGEVFKKMVETPYFRIKVINDVFGAEICGALKNVIALGVGFVDGLALGDNTRAAIIRIGLLEMKRFAQKFYTGVKDDTFFESCGVADLITTCYGGRNRKVAEQMIKQNKSLLQLEQEMLQGQKLQGTGAAKEVYKVLQKHDLESDFPLFVKIYKICFEKMDPKQIIKI